MKHKKKSKKIRANLKAILQFTQDSFDDFITIILWVILWSMVEPYINNFHVGYRLTMIVLIIVFLNKRLLKFPQPTKKYKKRKITLNELAEKIENINNRV